ncbi:hypothetical protein EV679_0339 [Kerstersia gyiorum]|uniref:Uncharacterized protein n=1 Tax=Kerstersia gyiorum TaxID=206506 RepID=A0A4Q7MVW5_9BURK|nr:hypothetical protein EV679_0339 [Kerstersia gyiorum]
MRGQTISLTAESLCAGEYADLRTHVLQRSLLPLKLLQNHTQTLLTVAIGSSEACLKTSNQLCSKSAIALFCRLRQPISQICRHTEIYLGICACHERNVRHHSA